MWLLRQQRRRAQKRNEDCNDYNARCDWRQITQAEWEKLNSPTYLPLCQEEATIVLQKRIESRDGQRAVCLFARKHLLQD